MADDELSPSQQPAADEDAPSAEPALKNPSLDDTALLTPASSSNRPVESTTSSQRFGDYEVLEEIARGGMGVVYKARQKSLGRVVALKMILDGQLASEQLVKRFQGEAEAAARLDHSGIVPVYEVGALNGRHFFSMALVEGGSLLKLLARGPLPAKEAADLVRQIAEAIEYAHQQGVVHRDLKPQNILLDKQGRPKITDFGLAKRLDSADGLTASGDIVGTPGYMPPEQALGKIHELGPLVDVYALGALLYFLLAARPPFQAATIAETLKQIIEQEPVSPRLLNPATPLDLETICLKALQKAPARRYQSAQALADDLGRYLRGEPIQARPVSAAEKAIRFCRRKPAVAALMGAAAALLLGAVALVIVSSRLSVARANALAQISKLASLESERRELKANAKAKEAELQLQVQAAATADYFRKLSEMERRADERPLGWTWDQQKSIQEAADLNTRAVNNAELRNHAALAAVSFDLRPVATIDDTLHVSALACSPDGKWAALAQLKNWLDGTVLIKSLPTGETVHKLSYPSHKLWSIAAQRQDGAVSMAISSESRWIAVGTRSGMIHLWDLTSSPPKLSSWQAERQEIEGLVFLPDGQRFVSACSASPIKYWSVESPGESLATIDAMKGSRIAADGHGRFLATQTHVLYGSDYSRRQEMDIRAASLAIHPGGRLIAAGGSGGEVWLVDATTGRIALEFIDPKFGKAHEGRFVDVAVDPRGELLATTTTSQHNLWELATGKLVGSVPIGDAEEARVAFTGGGRYLVGSGNRKTVVYEIAGRDDSARKFPDVQSLVAVGNAPISAFDVATDDRDLVTLSHSRDPGKKYFTGDISSWNLATGARQMAAALDLTFDDAFPSAGSVAWDHQGKFLAATDGSGNLSLLECAEKTRLVAHRDTRPPPASWMVVEEDRFELVGGEVAAVVRDDPLAANGRAVRVELGQPDWPLRLFPHMLPLGDGVFAVYARLRAEEAHDFDHVCRTAITKVGDVIVQQNWWGMTVPSDRYTWCKVDEFAQREDSSHFFAVATIAGGRPVWVDSFAFVPLARDHAHDLEFSHDGTRLLGLAGENQVLAWQVPDLAIANRYSNEVPGMLFGKGTLNDLVVGRERAYLVGADEQLKWLEAVNCEVKHTVWLHTNIAKIAVAADENWCAIGYFDGLVQTYSLPGCELLQELPRHRESVAALTVSPSGHWLASSSRDSILRLHRRESAAQNFSEYVTVPMPAPIKQLQFTSGEQLLLLLENERAVRRWDLAALQARLAAQLGE